MGLGVLVPGPRGPQDAHSFAHAYFNRLSSVFQGIGADPQSFWAARWEQVRAVTTQCTWAIRAAEWEQFLRRRVST